MRVRTKCLYTKPVSAALSAEYKEMLDFPSDEGSAQHRDELTASIVQQSPYNVTSLTSITTGKKAPQRL